MNACYILNGKGSEFFMACSTEANSICGVDIY